MIPALLQAPADPVRVLITGGMGTGKTTLLGTVRAALAWATGSVPGALSFQIAPLSLTRFHVGPQGHWSVAEVNWQK